MEIKDRVAIDDDYFFIQEIGTGKIKDYVRLVRWPTEVKEVGTPINKALLQPLVDNLDVIDISSDFVLQQEEGFVDNYEAVVYKVGRVVSGFICFSNSTGVGLIENVRVLNKSKFVPMHTTFSTNGYTYKSDSNGAISQSSVVYVALNEEYVDIVWELIPFVCDSVAFSFTYLCKELEEQNGDS
jgi:hypothetical protein